MAPEPSPINNELIGEGYAYWLRKRGARAMPSRADLDPSELKRVLPHVMLVDVLGPRQYRYRLIGTECVVAHGINATGQTLDVALKDDQYRAHVIGLYDQCVSECRPLYSESLFFQKGADIDRHVKVLFLPLSNDGATANMIFVIQVIQFVDEQARKDHFTSIKPHKEIVRATL
ncbi:MAG: PAS domain-containing protein [Alphaproteobacteria bacterium]|nr:PAS domain-containing protein [Alphaproteobacteria bacterium]